MIGFLTSRLSQKINNSRASYVKSYLSGDDAYRGSHIDVSGTNALHNTTFWACCRVLAETFASIPIAEYKKTAGGDRVQTDDTGLYPILHDSPNQAMSAYNFSEASQYHINIAGNFVCKKNISKSGRILSLIPIPWENVSITISDTTGLPTYLVNTKAGTKTYPRSDIYHITGTSFDGIVGVSPVHYLSEAIRLGLTYENFSVNFFKNGAIPSGVFETPGVMEDTSFKRFRDELSVNYQDLVNVGKPLILEGGTKFSPNSFKPVDAQLLDCRRFQSEEICRAMRVPPHMIQDLSRSTNNNIEHQSIEFIMYTMLPICKREEAAVNSQLLSPVLKKAGYYFERNLSGLLRGDQKSMADAFAVGRQWGWLSVNDIRRLLNMNKIDNGDVYLQPMNMVEAGKIKGEIEKDAENISKLIDRKGENV